MFFKFEGSDEEKPDDNNPVIDEDSGEEKLETPKPQKNRSASTLEKPSEKFQTDQYPMAFSFHTGVSIEEKIKVRQKMAEAVEKSSKNKTNLSLPPK